MTFLSTLIDRFTVRYFLFVSVLLRTVRAMMYITLPYFGRIPVLRGLKSLFMLTFFSLPILIGKNNKQDGITDKTTPSKFLKIEINIIN